MSLWRVVLFDIAYESRWASLAASVENFESLAKKLLGLRSLLLQLEGIYGAELLFRKPVRLPLAAWAVHAHLKPVFTRWGPAAVAYRVYQVTPAVLHCLLRTVCRQQLPPSPHRLILFWTLEVAALRLVKAVRCCHLRLRRGVHLI